MIRDDILQGLRNGMPLDDLKRKYRSQSQLYEAFRIFSEEMEKRLNGERENLREVQEKLSKANDDFRSVQNERNKVADESGKLSQERDLLKPEVGNMTAKRDQLSLEVNLLEEEGYTPDVIKKLKLVDAKSGLELLSRVQTVEKHDQLQREVGGLEKRKGDLNGEVKALEVEKKNTEQQTISEGNVLDELKRKTASFKETLLAVDTILKEGYHPRDLKSMALGLKFVGIKGNPAGSVTRLVEGLEDMKSLEAVEEKLRRKQDELADRSRALDQVKDELAVIRETTLKAIEEVRDASKQAIAGVGEKAREETLQTARNFESRAGEAVSNIDVKIQEMTERQRVEVKDVAELEHRKAEVEQVLGPSLALARALESPEDLKKVPVSFIMQLLEGTRSWVEMNMAEFLVRPTEAIRATDLSLLTINRYKPAALIELLKEGLKQFVMQQGKK